MVNHTKNLPKILYYKRHQFDSRGVELKYIESCSYGDYYVKCEGSSSMIQYISAMREKDILENKDQDFFVSRVELMKNTIKLHERRVSDIYEDWIANE